MKHTKLPKHLGLFAVSLIAGAMLVGCEANGGGISIGGGGGDEVTDGPSFPNDGTTPTDVTTDLDGDGNATDDVAVIDGQPGRFICTAGTPRGTTSDQSPNQGLVSGPVGDLLGGLGGGGLTSAVAGEVKQTYRAIDLDLESYSVIDINAAGLGSLLGVVAQDFFTHKISIPAGQFAVFGVSFPTGTVGLTLLSDIVIQTYSHDETKGDDISADTPLESRRIDQSGLQLLGAINTNGTTRAWIGLRATQAFNRAQIALAANLLNVSVGDDLRVHEMCVDGTFIPAP